MKKTIISLLMVLTFTGQAYASVDTVSVTQYRSNDTLNEYVKNNSNKKSATVKLELQKNGKTISTQTAYSIKPNQQVKKVFKMTSKGAYQVKYTFNGKYSYTPKVTKK